MDHQGAIDSMSTSYQIFICGIEGAISYGHIVRRYCEDTDKFKGWEGPIEANLRSVRYLPKKTKRKIRSVNK